MTDGTTRGSGGFETRNISGASDGAPGDDSKTPGASDVVELEVPADPAYLGVVRTACSGLGARLDLTLDEIEDLRIAVDEACALVLGPAGAQRRPSARLLARFTLGRSALSITVHGPNTDLPRDDNFAWTVLQALAGDVGSGQDDSGAWIRLTHERGRLT